MSELLPCPFDAQHQLFPKDLGEDGLWITCQDCAITLPIERWNVRSQRVCIFTYWEGYAEDGSFRGGFVSACQKKINPYALKHLSEFCCDCGGQVEIRANVAASKHLFTEDDQ